VDNGEGPKIAQKGPKGPKESKKAVQKRSRRVLRLPSHATGLRLCSPFNTTLILTEKLHQDSVG
ncbi:hypothetical protein SERLADRAFT_375512, partial [Serpula lacrymans var. lacrymans S7.9]